MKMKYIVHSVIILFTAVLACSSRATDITATNSGHWSDTNIWNTATVPGENDDADIQPGVSVLVDTNVTIQFIYDAGTVTMAPNSTLIITTDQAISSGTTLNATAPGSTVMYTCNPYDAKSCDYFNLILNNTNWVPPASPYISHYEDFNNFFSGGASAATPITVYGDMTVMGYIKVQEANVAGVPITVYGNLTIGSGCAWDCSSGSLTVMSNLFLYGMLEDLDSANGSNYIGGNVLVSGPSVPGKPWSGGTVTNGWYLGDVTSWGIGGGLTNDGAIYGIGYASIFFNGTGSIAGSNILTLPTMVVSSTGTYTIDDTIILTTNNADFHGTLIFDLANTNQIVLQYNANGANTQTTYYDGNLTVIDSGAPPVTGKSYQLFSAASYAGVFASQTLPPLANGLSWVDNLATSGSFAVTGSAGSPIITLMRTGNQLSLNWDSTTFPGYSVLAQTNRTGPGANWIRTDSGTVSPYTVTMNPTNAPVFYRLSNP